MADIRCPMCGRPNPEDRDVCEFCGARLKPLTGALAAANAEPIHPGEEPTPKSTSELEKTLPEWLRSLRQGEEKPGEQPPQEPASEGDDSDDFFKHLAALGTEAAPPPEEPAQLAPLQEPPANDLLSRLAGLGASPPEPAGEVPAESANDDLFARLTGLGAAAAGPAMPSESKPAAEPVDWLAGLSSAQEDEEDETPDWLKNITGQFEQPASAAPEATGEDVDWRSQLQEQEKPAQAPPQEPEPEWQGFLGQTDLPAAGLTDQSAEGEEAPDWLKALETEAGATAGQPQPEEPQTAGDETPAWLAGLRGGNDFPSGASTIAAGTPETPEEAGAPDEDLPDWLKPAAAAAAGAALISGREPEEPPAAGEVPDWLQGLQGSAAEPPATPAEAGSIPEWLKPPAEADATAVSMQPASPTRSEETPDWLEASQTEAEPAPAPAEEEGIPDWLKAAAAAGAVAAVAGPEKLAEEPPAEPPTLVGASAIGAAEGAPQAPESEPEKEAPAWLKGMAAGAAVGAAASALEGQPEAEGEELFPAALPAWLADIQPGDEATGAPELPAGEAPISQGDLPSWVQAMRPVEAAEVAGADEEQVVEKSGPLAGFSNVLPIGAGAAMHRVSAYPNKLLLNEAQQSQVELLERQIASERKARPVPARARLTSNRMLRWGIAALLIAFVSLPILFQSQVTPGISLSPPELVATIKVINALPPDATVLAVVDYQPASSGELEAVATPLLDQLRLRGATVIFVSSTAPGSALADRLVARVDSDLNGSAAQQYLNLGYLTGGASGIANFAADPAQATPHTVSGLQAWGLPPLQNVGSLSDFAAMVVLTDSSDTGAMWIEQAGARLGISPLVLAISAQAEPMLQPYYDSQQVQGIVTGLPGGVAYAQANGISSLGSHYWDGFSVGFLVADFIVAIGGVMALLAAWQSRRTRPVGEAA